MDKEMNRIELPLVPKVNAGTKEFLKLVDEFNKLIIKDQLELLDKINAHVISLRKKIMGKIAGDKFDDVFKKIHLHGNGQFVKIEIWCPECECLQKHICAYGIRNQYKSLHEECICCGGRYKLGDDYLN